MHFHTTIPKLEHFYDSRNSLDGDSDLTTVYFYCTPLPPTTIDLQPINATYLALMGHALSALLLSIRVCSLDETFCLLCLQTVF